MERCEQRRRHLLDDLGSREVAKGDLRAVTGLDDLRERDRDPRG